MTPPNRSPRRIRGRLGNTATRTSRDLRMALGERYQRLLSGQGTSVQAAVAASGLVDHAMALREWTRSGGMSPVLARQQLQSWAQTRRSQHTFVVRIAVGTDQVSLSVRGDESGERPDGVRLHQGQSAYELDLVAVSHGELTRLTAIVPAAVWTGEPWAVAVTVGGVEHQLVAGPRSTLETPADRVDGEWPPRVERRVDGAVVLRGRAADVAGVEHRVRLGAVTLSAQFTLKSPLGKDTHSGVELVLARSGASDVEAAPAVVDEAGQGRADLDLRRVADRPGPWRVFVADVDGRRPLRLPRGEYPALDRLIDRRRARVPRADGVMVPIEVGYAKDNHLTVRVGRAEPATS